MRPLGVAAAQHQPHRNTSEEVGECITLAGGLRMWPAGESQGDPSVKRLSMSRCPACDHANADDVRFCGACGSPLVTRCPSCKTINARTRTRCHHCAAALHGETDRSTEESSDDTAVTASLSTLPLPLPVIETAAVAAEGDDVTLSLRVDSLPRTERARPMPRPPQPVRFPVLLDVDDSPPAEPKPAARKPEPKPEPPPAAAPAAAPERPEPASLAERKAEMRAAVRRARQRQLRRMMPVAAGARPEVLLLEHDPDTRTRLAAMLDQFGFSAHAVASVRDAEALVGSTRFVAVFVGLGHQDAQAVGFCSRLREETGTIQRPMSVVAMVEEGRHADRVRMELAGADAVLFRPVDRGAVARVLEDGGVPLPRDPRATRRAH